MLNEDKQIINEVPCTESNWGYGDGTCAVEGADGEIRLYPLNLSGNEESDEGPEVLNV